MGIVNIRGVGGRFNMGGGGEGYVVGMGRHVCMAVFVRTSLTLGKGQMSH